MRILYHELRKIWRPSILLALLALGAMHYYLLMDFSIRFFPNGHLAIEQYQTAREWTEKYGHTMEPAEYADAKAEYEAMQVEVDARLAADPHFAQYGVASWKDYQTFQEQILSQDDGSADLEAYRELSALLFGEEYDFAGYRLEERCNALIDYEFRQIWVKKALAVQTPAEQARKAELLTTPRINGIFANICIDNLSEYACWAGIFAILSVVILLTPFGVRENLSRMPSEQWPTRTGRGICRYQFAAMLLSSAALFLLELLIFGSIYATTGTGFFWNSPTQTFLLGDFFWFDLTYGQYVLCSLGMVLLLMLGAAGAVFALSYVSTSSISAILKVLPLTVALVFATAAVTVHPFTDANELYQHTRIMGVEGMLCGLVCLLGLSAGAAFVWYCGRKELF